MDCRKRFCALVITFSIILFSSYADAQLASISSGLSYLQSTQTPEGYWGAANEVPYNSFLDTCNVTEAMRVLNVTGTAYSSAIQWMNPVEVTNNDYLFAKYMSLSQAGMELSAIRDTLIASRNNDGGWGVTAGGTSDNDHGVHDHDEITVKFSRSAVIAVLPAGEHVPVHITGRIGTTTFEGVDIIRVIEAH